MLQVIEGKHVYVVDFDTMAELPIQGLTQTELIYETILTKCRGFIHPSFDREFNRTGRYARSLNDAFEKEIITEPGKYGIYLVPGTADYEIFKIVE